MSYRSHDVRPALPSAVCASLLARLIGRAQTFALTPWQRLQAAWPALALEFATRIWPAAASESRRAETPAAGTATTVWKIVERNSSVGSSLPSMRTEATPGAVHGDATQLFVRESMAAAEPVTITHSVRQRLEWRPPSVLPERLAQPGSLTLASNSAAAFSNYRVMPGDAGQARDASLPAPDFHREDLPAFAAPPVSTDAQDSSVIDHLFSNPERPASFSGLTFHVLRAAEPAELPKAASPERPWYMAPAPAPATALEARFSRADVDLLAARVMTQIRREERLERESKGLL